MRTQTPILILSATLASFLSAGCMPGIAPDASLLQTPDRYIAKGSVDRYGARLIRVSASQAQFDQSNGTTLSGVMGIGEDTSLDSQRKNPFMPEFIAPPGTAGRAWMIAFRLERDPTGGTSKLRAQTSQCDGEKIDPSSCELITDIDMTITSAGIQGTGTSEFASNGPVVYNPISFSLEKGASKGDFTIQVQQYWNLGTLQGSLNVSNPAGPDIGASASVPKGTTWGVLSGFNYDADIQSKLTDNERLAIALLPTISLSPEFMIWITVEN